MIEQILDLPKEAVVSTEAQGPHKKAIETVLNLKGMGLSTHQIANTTDLTIEEVEKLK